MTMGSSQQYCLRWNNHQNNLLTVFSRLLGSEQFTDVLLAAEGCTIRAHKVVLSACSTYFENLFLTFSEKNQIVILKDTSYADMTAVVEFMYKGEINVAQEQLPSLLRTAENLRVKGLAEVSSVPVADDSDQLTTTTPTSNGKKAAESSSAGTSYSGNEVKRKRGRPRTLDSPNELPDPCFAPRIDSVHSLTPHGAAKHARIVQNKVSKVEAPAANDDSLSTFENGNVPTPGGPFTPDRISELGIVKLNDYLASGTRHQFWDEFYVKVIMQAVKNKELDMKGAAEYLGVSYGTLYGRYRETFGYLKHGWNIGMRHKYPAGFPSNPAEVDEEHIFEQLGNGRINIKQAGNLLGLDPTMLAYQLALKTSQDNDEDFSEDEEDRGDNSGSMMEVQPDIVMENEDDEDEDVETIETTTRNPLHVKEKTHVAC